MSVTCETLRLLGFDLAPPCASSCAALITFAAVVILYCRERELDSPLMRFWRTCHAQTMRKKVYGPFGARFVTVLEQFLDRFRTEIDPTTVPKRSQNEPRTVRTLFCAWFAHGTFAKNASRDYLTPARDNRYPARRYPSGTLRTFNTRSNLNAREAIVGSYGA